MTAVHTSRSRFVAEPTFEDELASVVGRLSSSIRAIIDALPHRGPISRPADIQKALGIRATLAWHVIRTMNAAGSRIDASHIPGPGAMRKFFEAAAKRRVPKKLISDASDALDAFHALVKTHASDRQAFSSMLSGLESEGAESVDVPRRRTAFKTMSHILGMQAKIQLAWRAIQPNAKNPDRIDTAILRGFHGWCRLRSNAQLTLSRVRVSNSSGAPLPAVARPLAMADDVGQQYSLIPEFCTKPLPSLKTLRADFGFMNIVLEGNQIGNRSSVDCFTGEVLYDAIDRYRAPDEEQDRSQVLVRTPTETLIMDILIHEDAFGPLAPRVAIYTDHACTDPNIENPAREHDLLPQRESVQYLGKGIQVLSDRDIPRHVEISQYAFDQLGWNPAKFDVYRCKVEYPIVPSSVVVSFPLPEKPGGAV